MQGLFSNQDEGGWKPSGISLLFYGWLRALLVIAIIGLIAWAIAVFGNPYD